MYKFWFPTYMLRMRPASANFVFQFGPHPPSEGIEQPKKCAAGGPGSPKLLPELTSLRGRRVSGKASQLAGDLAVKCFRFCDGFVSGEASKAKCHEML